MFLHAPSRTLVALQGAGGPSSPRELHFIDVSTKEGERSVTAISADWVHGFEGLFLASHLRDGITAWSIGRVDSRHIECIATVTRDGTSASHDTGLLDVLPDRIDLGPGYLAERQDGEFMIRVLDLDRLLGHDEMRWVWRITPDGRHAIAWRLKGWPEWPVLDLETCEIVNRVESRGPSEPMLGFADDGSAHVGVHDQIHYLSSVHGQLSEGVRLKDDTSGSFIGRVAAESDGSVTLSWFGREQLPQMMGVASVADLTGAIQRDPAGFNQSVMNAGRYGRVLTFDPDAQAVTRVARFGDWGIDPIVIDDHAYVRSWSPPHSVDCARLEPQDWPIYLSREPGDTMWF